MATRIPLPAIDNSFLGSRELAWVERQAASWNGAFSTRITLRQIDGDAALLFRWLAANEEYRRLMAEAYRHHWRIAKRKGIRQSTFSRQWRSENAVLKVFDLLEHIKYVIEYRRMQTRRRSCTEYGSYTKQDVDEIRLSQGNQCVYCSISFSEVQFEIDHKRPIVNGGLNVRENLQLLCRRCNRRKGRLSDKQFRQRLKSEAVAAAGMVACATP